MSESNTMTAEARERLRGIPHAHAHVGAGSDLAQFADASFDYVYSYAVFQHIPSREVVMNYLAETVRVLKPGGLVRAQINGLPKTAKVYDTWSGVRISGEEVRDFCREHGLRLLALEGLDTQYMWTTWQKPGISEPGAEREFTIRRITNAYSSEPVAPPAGRFASISAWVDNLPPQADLLSLRLEVNGHPATLTYLGREEADGLRQLNALLPPGLPTGMGTVVLRLGAQASPPRSFRIVPTPPAVPRILAVTDGVDLLHVGMHDLAASLGATNPLNPAQIEEIFDRVLAAASCHGKHVGVGGLATDEAMLRKLIKRGVGFVSTGTDLNFLLSAASARARFVHDAARDR